MRIERIRLDHRSGNPRISANVVWEDCDRSVQELYFQTGEEFAQALTPSPAAFLAAAVLPAMDAGEKRIFVEGEICPEFHSGLVKVMSAIRYWSRTERDLVRIEGGKKRSVTTPRPERAGLFLTGGVDSLAALRVNRLSFPLEHPGSVKDAILIFGLEVDQPAAFQHVLNSLSIVAQDAGVKLIPVETNIRYLNDDWVFWYWQFMGAALCAVAHVFARRLSVVSIASDYDLPNLRPHGSHPLIEPNFSSYDVRISYEGITLSRLAKTRLLADWDVALQNLRVCNKSEYYRSDRLNCGECEKCVRTMLALLVVGALKRACTFPQTDVSEELLSQTRLSDKVYPFYQELILPLQEIGRADLARCIERKLSPYRVEVGWKKRLAGFDRKYLNGNLIRLKRTLLSSNAM